MNVRKVLCTTDFSDHSYHAVDAAAGMARACGAELHLLHVVSPLPSIASHIPPSGFNMSLYQEEMEKHAWEVIKKVAAGRALEGLEVKAHVVQGDPARHILQFARENGVSLIVIASRGQGGWGLGFGSVAEKVARLSPVPVLLVPVEKGEQP
jgi:nucleotide-binding universal stress UspA family protein